MAQTPKRSALREELEIYYRLNGREMDVLKELSRGKTVREVSVALEIIVGNVENRIESLKRKFATRSLDDLRLIGRWLRSGTRYYPPEVVKPEVLTCVECSEENLPITKFPAFPVDRRCDSCVMRMVITSKKANTRAAISRSLRKVLDQTRKSVNLPDVNELLGVFAEAHGGIENVAQEWFKHVAIAAEKNPGSKYVLDHYRDYARALTKANDVKPANIDNMEEEELREYLTNMVLSNLADENKEDLLSVLVPPEMNEGESGEKVRETG